MRFWKTNILVTELRENSLNENDFKNYYLASSVLLIITEYLALFGKHENLPALALEYIGSLVVTIYGVNAAFAANGGSSGSRFLEKTIAISFPLLIKVLVVGFLLGTVIQVFKELGNSQSQCEWGNALSIIAIQIVLYWRLAIHIKNTNA